MGEADIGLIGLAVMGENLVLNMESKGFAVAVFNRTVQKVDDFVAGRGAGKRITACHSVGELASSLKSPRKVMMMVKAGAAVDETIEHLLGVLSPGDIIIDGGNSNYEDTIRRTAYIESKGLLYIGAGVSGGEEGALLGPSIMPGGSPEAWPEVKSILQAIAAKVEDGSPCCEWVGENGAGHFVKMVHNGIEYGDMQIISEVYQLMRDLLGMSPDEMSEVYAEWNSGDLDSYLVEITANILRVKDADGSPLVDKILDAAGQKGTGKWTGIAALNQGVPLTLITEAVFARCLSSEKDERMEAAVAYGSAQAYGQAPAKAATAGGSFPQDRAAFIAKLKDALYASKIISYTQGFLLLRAAAKEYGWNLNYGGIALMWRGGCIIRSAFLGKIKEAFDAEPALPNLLLAPFFKDKIEKAEAGWRYVIGAAVANGVPVPAMSAALSYFDGYRCARLPANLIQAQRDYFGAHTYERVDAPRGTFFHTNWTGHGGSTASTAYNA
ncbi:MAG: decarboxylating NADP(+)-dependent phosphogluconate dehydrogenase [Spirochaetaceae bacterium]|nr:decarboxylating NADP(+)-dependent phosphogluconate dehydrogenase [Spirochaetaceae bacterium]